MTFKPRAVILAATAILCAIPVFGAACPKILAPSYKLPIVANGWTAQIVANGLTKPRSIQFDGAGGLLVVESGKGLSRLVFNDNGGTCLEVASYTNVINETTLNHGLALSSDGAVVFVSTPESVYGWTYDGKSGSVQGVPKTVVSGMNNNDLTTRTLLMSSQHNTTMLISRGSSQDYDVAALDVTSGLSQIRAFDLAPLYGTKAANAYDFDTTGLRVGWGLRNSVGMAEHPITGGIYSVENSIDDVSRDGTDIHQGNPGEELNYHGSLANLTSTNQGGNYGYPDCFAVWNTDIPDNTGVAVGDQISMSPNSNVTDKTCEQDFIAPALTFPAHMAPLDLKFSTDGATAYVTFHGSSDKTNPVGFHVSSIDFDGQKGTPRQPPSSTTVLNDILSNADVTKCPGGCFRPVGLAWDPNGRLFVSSDATGEIFVLAKTSASSSGTFVTATKSSSAASSALMQNQRSLMFGFVIVVTIIALF